MTKPTLSAVIRMAQSVAQREVQSPKRENTTAMKQAIESVLQMIESKSDKVIFLKDESKPSQSSIKDGLPLIHTARSYEDINRAASAGFWPDVRWIEYKDSTFVTKLSIGQNPVTGRIDGSSDFRSIPDHAIGPFKQFYPYYQNTPIAAYLIPKNLPDGTEVIVADPIDEII